jgi:hypothetical protein
MAIVDSTRLNRFLSSPKWRDDQFEEADDLLDELEQQLGDQLATYVTPVPYAETCTVLQSGLLATRHPVHSVTTLNGVPVDNTHPLPASWTLLPVPESRLRWIDLGNFPPLTLPQFNLMTGWSPVGTVPRVDGIGAVAINYLAGWGNLPALRKALLTKAGIVFLNRHDDSVIARNLDSQEPPPLPTENWTTAELAPLGVYRNLTAWK